MQPERLPRSAFVLLAGAWSSVLALGCNPAREASAHSSASPSELGSSESEAQHAHAEPHSAPHPTPRGTLSLADRDEVTKLRVSAHVGSVIMRKREDGWEVAGLRGCKVPKARIDAALQDLVELEATPSEEPLPPEARFELQIDALVGERPALHLEIARRDEQGELARLLDDATVNLRGLDRSLWLPEPEAWCRN